MHGSPLEATDPSGMMDSYEMIGPDPREAALTAARGPRSLMVSNMTGTRVTNRMSSARWRQDYSTSVSAFSITWGRQVAYQEYKAAFNGNQERALAGPDDVLATLKSEANHGG